MRVHGSELIQDLRKNCGGDYENALVALVAPRARTVAGSCAPVHTTTVKSALTRRLIFFFKAGSHNNNQ